LIRQKLALGNECIQTVKNNGCSVDTSDMNLQAVLAHVLKELVSVGVRASWGKFQKWREQRRLIRERNRLFRIGMKAGFATLVLLSLGRK
jgi:hypothetical protein